MNDDWLMFFFSAIFMEEYDGILDDERFHENRTSGLRNDPELSNSWKKRCEIDIDGEINHGKSQGGEASTATA